MGFAGNFDRRNANLKEIRLILMDLAGSNKPWEVAVGQGIAGLSATSSREDGSLSDLLGHKIIGALQLIPGEQAPVTALAEAASVDTEETAQTGT